MRRSRRSLVLLLASMALSLVIVRATSTPARQSPESANSKKLATSKVAVTRVPVLNTAEHRDHPPPVLDCAAVPPVSATAIIVIVPRGPVHAREIVQTGWSGCTAYANGCDHLGRCLSLSPETTPRLVARLIVGPMVYLVQKATDVADGTASLFIQTESQANLPPEMANPSARTTGESSITRAKPFDLRL